jgi:hypothetical protein
MRLVNPECWEASRQACDSALEVRWRSERQEGNSQYEGRVARQYARSTASRRGESMT